MKNLFRWAGAAALVISASPAVAQTRPPLTVPGADGTSIPTSPNYCSIDAGLNWTPCPPASSNTTPRGGSTILTGQISVGTTATLIAAARANRQKIGVTVTSAVQCAFGPAGVTLATGWPLAAVAYAADNWDTASALYAVCASAATIAYREQF